MSLSHESTKSRTNFCAHVLCKSHAWSILSLKPTSQWASSEEKRLENEPEDVLLVSVADKLHNARATLADRRSDGPSVWLRFNVGVEDQRWYYEALVEVFARRLPRNRLAVGLERTVAELFAE